MKYMKWLAAGALLALALISFALFVHNASAQQETKPPKFRSAPAGAKGVKADIYTVLFDQKLSEEDFERELERVMRVYDARLADSTELDSDVKAKIPDLRWAVLRVPEARAKQIAEDAAVVEVAQSYQIPLFTDPPEAERPRTPATGSPSEKRWQPGKNVKPEKKRPEESQIEFKDDPKVAARATTFYHLDRIDSRPRAFNPGQALRTSRSSTSARFLGLRDSINSTSGHYLTQ